MPTLIFFLVRHQWACIPFYCEVLPTWPRPTAKKLDQVRNTNYLNSFLKNKKLHVVTDCMYCRGVKLLHCVATPPASSHPGHQGKLSTEYWMIFRQFKYFSVDIWFNSLVDYQVCSSTGKSTIFAGSYDWSCATLIYNIWFMSMYELYVCLSNHRHIFNSLWRYVRNTLRKNHPHPTDYT